ncbi:hypothetical protein QR680_014244 [Steinernema hermaphroditum]|uniref:Rho-GAP domain-containing protein n=1 Tax=Steinernema hermaphroditum TaxID=289476 RepID=A0AA39IAX7_9BILA|nr:hypothetical protein QR680_014244 [Steinernema hermaphroditum]
MNQINNSFEDALFCIKESFENEIALMKTIKDLRRELELSHQINKGLNTRLDKLQEEKLELENEVQALKEQLFKADSMVAFLEWEQSSITEEISGIVELMQRKSESDDSKMLQEEPPVKTSSQPSDDSGFFEQEILLSSPLQSSTPIRKQPTKRVSFKRAEITRQTSAPLPKTPVKPSIKRFHSQKAEEKKEKEPTLKSASINTRKHTFKSFSPKLESCDVCGLRIVFNGKPAVKCSDCQIRVHTACRTNTTGPCFSRQKNVKSAADKTCLDMADFCSLIGSAPKIPFPVIQCVAALERKGLEQEGLYRKPGSEATVKKLLGEFLSARPFPKMDSQAPGTITGCLKKFLNSLNETVVPVNRLNAFVEAEDEEALKAAIMKLSRTCRDTLAYLCVHLQKVVQKGEHNKMTVQALSRCVGPSIVATCPEKNIMEATNNAISVMGKLLELPSGYWLKLLDGLMDVPPPTLPV